MSLFGRDGRRSITQNTFLNLVGQLVPMLIGLFSIPLLIQHIGMDRFGLLSLIWIVIGYFTFFDLGLGRAIIKLVAEKIGDRREEEIPRIFWNALLIMTSMSIVGSIVLFALTPLLVKSVFKIPEALHEEAIKAFYGLSLSLILVTLTAGFRGVLEARQRFDFANLLHILMGASTFVGPLIMSYFTHDLFLLVLVLLMVRFLIFLAHLWFVFILYPELRNPARIEKATLRRLFRFATWMTVSNVISPIMVYFDRFILGAIVPIAYLAFYTTPYEIVNRLLVVPAAVVRTIFPTFSSMGVDQSSGVDAIFLKCVKWLAFVLFPTILFIVYFGQEGLSLWLGKEFSSESTAVLQILSIGILLNGIAFIPTTLLQSAERPDLTAKIHLLEFPFYLPSVWFMASHFGIRGAAIAWTIRVAVDMFLLFCAVGWLLPRMARELLRLLWPLLLCLALFAPAFFGLSFLERLSVAGGIAPLFMLLFWVYILRLEDRLMVLGRLGITAVKPSRFQLGVSPEETSFRGEKGVWAVVVTFNPGDEVIDNIKSYASQVEGAIVVDNGSHGEMKRRLDELEAISGVEIIRGHINLGIAAALNIGVKKAHAMGAEWVLTFDQDSHVGPGYVESLIRVYESSPKKQQVALIAPSYYDELSGREYRANGKPEEAVREVNTAFTSGSMVKMEVLEKIGLFEEDFFIDYVDHEIALRLLAFRYVLLEARDIRCFHHLGKLKIHGVGKKGFSATHHAPFRRYYMSRNRIIVYRRFFWILPEWVFKDIKASLKEVLKILLVENEKFQKLVNVIRGIGHGFKYRQIARRETAAHLADVRVGVVLATYNPPVDLLEYQLKSIRSQSYENWFCVINDDHSSSEVQMKIRELAESILGYDSEGRARFLFRVNGGDSGVVGNFANGLLALPPDCRLVCFCDQDDLWVPYKLQVLKMEFDNPKVALAHSDMRLIDGIGGEIFPSCWLYEGRDVERTDISGLILRNTVSGCALMFRREVLEFCLPFPDQSSRERPWFYHDVWIALGAKQYGEIRAVAQPLLGYRQHERNVVGAEPGFFSKRKKGRSRRSNWSVRKFQTAWRSRAVLEDVYIERFHKWTQKPKNVKTEMRPGRVFSSPLDFGLRSFILVFRVTLRSPRTIVIALPIAFGKLFADIERVATSLGLRKGAEDRKTS